MIKKRHQHNSIWTRKGKIDRKKAVYQKEKLAHQIPVGQKLKTQDWLMCLKGP